MSDNPYPENPGATHFDGCWRTRGHHNCAVAEVERLADDLAQSREWQQIAEKEATRLGRWTLELRTDIRNADEGLVRARAEADVLAGLLGRARGHVEAGIGFAETNAHYDTADRWRDFLADINAALAERNRRTT